MASYTDTVLQDGRTTTQQLLDAVHGYTGALTETVAGFQHSLTLPSVDASRASLETHRQQVITAPLISAGRQPLVPAAPAAYTGLSFTRPAIDIEPFAGNVPRAPALPAIDRPEDCDLNAPAAPALADLTVPERIQGELPAAPVLARFQAPTAPELTIEPFTLTLEAAPEAPLEVFHFEEPGFQSARLDTVTARLQSVLELDSTGLAAELWTRIWERAHAREATSARAYQRLAETEFSRIGIRIPSRALTLRVAAAAQEVQHQRATLDREAAIEEARQIVEHMRFVIARAIELELAQARFHDQQMARALTVARIVTDLGLRALELATRRYNAEVRGYQATAAAYMARIDAERLPVERYQAEVQAVQTEFEFARQHVALYSAGIEAQQARQADYRTELEAARLSLAHNRFLLDRFRAELQAHVERLRGVATQYDILVTEAREGALQARRYETDLRVFREQARAHRHYLDGTAAEAEARVSEAEARHAQQEANSRLTLTQTLRQAEDLLADAQEANTRAQSIASGYRVQVSDTNARAADARADAALDEADAYAETAKALAKLGTLLANVRIESAKDVADAAIDAQSTAATIGQISNQVSRRNSTGNSTSRNSRSDSSTTFLEVFRTVTD